MLKLPLLATTVRTSWCWCSELYKVEARRSEVLRPQRRCTSEHARSRRAPSRRRPDLVSAGARSGSKVSILERKKATESPELVARRHIKLG